MSKVLWHITMSLDGFIAPRDYSTDTLAGWWQFVDPPPATFASLVLQPHLVTLLALSLVVGGRG